MILQKRNIHYIYKYIICIIYIIHIADANVSKYIWKKIQSLGFEINEFKKILNKITSCKGKHICKDPEVDKLSVFN